MNRADLGRYLVPVLLAIAVLFAWMGTDGSPLRRHSLDASAQAYVDEGLKRALVTFATARVLNAVLSLAQGTQVSAQPLGVGVQVGVGQLLHPLNEMVGQFADLMLAACMAFGVMEILVRVGSHWSITLALTGVAAWYVVRRRQGAAAAIGKALVVLLLLRFAIPAISIGSDVIYRTFLAQDYQASQQAIALSTAQFTSQAPAGTRQAPAAEKHGCRVLPDWLCRKLAGEPPARQEPKAAAEPGPVDRVADTLVADLPGKIAKLRESAENMVEHVVTLMVVFLLQTAVIPLALGWVLLRGTWALAGRRPRSAA